MGASSQNSAGLATLSSQIKGFMDADQSLTVDLHLVGDRPLVRNRDRRCLDPLHETDIVTVVIGTNSPS